MIDSRGPTPTSTVACPSPWDQLARAATSGSAVQLVSVITDVLQSRTDRFAVLESDPPRWQLRSRGDAVALAEAGELPDLLGVSEPGRFERVESAGWHLHPVGGSVLVTVEDAALGELVSGLACVVELTQRNEFLAGAVALAETESEALRSVATRILGAKELDDALLAVTNETLSLLESDIAGVMLRDGEEIRMRACAGNQLADTGNLRMRRGQGLAGHVFDIGQAAKVDDYLRNDVISKDFNYLARAEKTRSALGAPLVVDGEVIGVLEVWRRRESIFTPNDIRRLVALADLAAIALDNARQHERSTASNRAAEVARRALQAQLGKVEHALVGQQALIAALIAGEQLPGIVRIVSERADCDVVLLDSDLELLAGRPTDADLRRIRECVRELSGQNHSGTCWTTAAGRSVAIRAVRTAVQEIGWVCLVTDAAAGDEALELAATQASLTFALHHLEQQSAARARAAMREDLLLNLLKGSTDERRGAIGRARYLQIDLRGPLRIAVCTMTGLDSLAQTCGWSSPNQDKMRRKLFHSCEEALTRAGLLRLAAGHGDELVALIRSADGVELQGRLGHLVDELHGLLPHCQPIFGVSAPYTNPAQLDRAYAEATTAAKALRQGAGRQVALYEDLGVLALLIAGPQNAPLSQFARDTLGPVLVHDSQHGTSLVETLRTYLDANCNQKEAAQRLFVHQKTVKYRLETIEKLTTMNLHEHADRMRADIAIRAIDLQ